MKTGTNQLQINNSADHADKAKIVKPPSRLSAKTCFRHLAGRSIPSIFYRKFPIRNHLIKNAYQTIPNSSGREVPCRFFPFRIPNPASRPPEPRRRSIRIKKNYQTNPFFNLELHYNHNDLYAPGTKQSTKTNPFRRTGILPVLHILAESKKALQICFKHHVQNMLYRIHINLIILTNKIHCRFLATRLP